MGGDGGPIPGLEVKARCSFQSSAKLVLTTDRREVQRSRGCLFDGDIVPKLPALASGAVEVAGGTYRLFLGRLDEYC